MEIKEYQKLAKVTCTSLGSDKLDLSHMVMGMCSEINEILKAKDRKDMINLSEEYGDFLFYLVNYCTFRGYDLQEVIKGKGESGVRFNSLSYYLSKLTDLVKKYVAYNKPIEVSTDLECLIDTYCSVQTHLIAYDLDLSVILDRNIAKLKARYGGKFTEEAALNRNLEVERSILEGNA